MIEVEMKFTAEKEDLKNLLEGAVFLEERKYTDSYYDSKTYDLTRKDIWLRARDGKFELKLSRNKEKPSNRTLDQYAEVTDEREIRRILAVGAGKSLKETIKSAGYLPFGTFMTIRKKYKKGEFVIDLDEVDFGYNVGEIELLVKNETEIEIAKRKIASLAKDFNLNAIPVRGKANEYIRRFLPEHNKVLEG